MRGWARAVAGDWGSLRRSEGVNEVGNKQNLATKGHKA